MDRVLIICEHNSARSQMFEEFLRLLGGKDYQVESAGFEPTQVNPLVVEVMKEEGIDLSRKQTNSVFEYYKEGRLYDYVITVCDDKNSVKCPIFPGIVHRLHLPFEEPAQLTGDLEEKLNQTRRIRDQIRECVLEFINNPHAGVNLRHKEA